MTMDLIGPQSEHSFTHCDWRMMINLALQYGWKPAGASPPDYDETAEDESDIVEIDAEVVELRGAEGQAIGDAIRETVKTPDDPILASYFFNAGHRVSSEDAQALANALERALPDLPDHDATEHKTFEVDQLPGVRLARIATPISPFEWFSGPNKEHLQDFIVFCRQGGFEIC